jgi:hypothetical protein
MGYLGGWWARPFCGEFRGKMSHREEFMPEGPTDRMSPEMQQKAERAAKMFVPLPPDTDEDPDHGF